MTPRSITLIGRNHTWSAPMTDAQRERAEPRFYDEHGRPWTAWRLLGIAVAWLAIGAWAYVMLAVLP